MQYHGPENNPRISPRSTAFSWGKFGRLFPTLPIQQPEEDVDLPFLSRLADSMIRNKFNPAESKLPAGYTYFGQFMAHDMSFDPTTIGERVTDPEFMRNFRTPALDLDSVYGGGPLITPYLFDKKFRFIVKNWSSEGSGNRLDAIDFQRNRDGVAIVVDARNDENVILARIQLVFQLLHNFLVNKYTLLHKELSTKQIFERAKRETIFYYQWIIIYDYLPRIIGRKKLNHLLNFKKSFGKQRKFYNWPDVPFIPIEFAVSAFRYGHTQVRDFYKIGNDKIGKFIPPFDSEDEVDLRSKSKFPIHLDLTLFFFNKDAAEIDKNFAHRIEPKIASSLSAISGFDAPGESNSDRKMDFLESLYKEIEAKGTKKLMYRNAETAERILKIWNQILEELKQNDPVEAEGIVKKTQSLRRLNVSNPGQKEDGISRLRQGLSNARFGEGAQNLLDLIDGYTPRFENLAFRTLLKGVKMALPSGQAVARLIKKSAEHVEFILPRKDKEQELEYAEKMSEFNKKYSENTPLWYYILEESKDREKSKVYGRRLGSVGSTIVGEVITGLIDGDDASFIRQFRAWSLEKVNDEIVIKQDGKAPKHIKEILGEGNDDTQNVTMRTLIDMLEKEDSLFSE